jgi:hypothetical protein
MPSKKIFPQKTTTQLHCVLNLHLCITMQAYNTMADLIQGRIFKLEFATNTQCYFGIALKRKVALDLGDEDDTLRLLYGKLDTSTGRIEYDDTIANCDTEVVSASLYLNNLYAKLRDNLEQQLRLNAQHIKALAELRYAD